MKYLIGTSMILAMISPDLAVAKHCHASAHRHLNHRHRAVSAETKTHHPIVIERDAPVTKVEIAEINLDAGGGRTLRQLLADNLGAEVEWGNGRFGERIVTGSYHGSPEFVAQQLLKDFQFAIFYDHSRLRIIVLRLNAPEVVADNRPRNTILPQVVPPPPPHNALAPAPKPPFR
jgi:hypothetical protein